MSDVTTTVDNVRRSEGGPARAVTAEPLFDVDTRVEAIIDQAFAATITDRWNALGGRPNGPPAAAVFPEACAPGHP